MVWFIEETKLSIRTQPPRITNRPIVNLLTIHFTITVRKNKQNVKKRAREEKPSIFINEMLLSGTAVDVIECTDFI